MTGPPIPSHPIPFPGLASPADLPPRLRETHMQEVSSEGFMEIAPSSCAEVLRWACPSAWAAQRCSSSRTISCGPRALGGGDLRAGAMGRSGPHSGRRGHGRDGRSQEPGGSRGGAGVATSRDALR